jgi:hypothetical protein
MPRLLPRRDRWRLLGGVAAALTVVVLIVVVLVAGRERVREDVTAPGPDVTGPAGGAVDGAGTDATGGVASGEGTDGGSSAAPARIAFPDAEADAAPAEERLRPIGVRSVARGFEAPLGLSTEPPGCDAVERTDDRAHWSGLAPGEHGVAVIVGTADPAAARALLAGIERSAAGDVVETARSNGTLLAWRVVDVVDVPVGSPFPAGVLAPVAEQRLLIVGCDAVVDGRARDVYVLAVRSR